MAQQRQPAPTDRRVYTIGPPLSEEQTAVAFAMTSRSPKPFDETAKEVSETRAADFHQKWVLDFGHASVAEHAVLHMAMENISRLAADAVESNRLASYTERSSRYQVIRASEFHVPNELEQMPNLRDLYLYSMAEIFSIYQQSVEQLLKHAMDHEPAIEGETEQQRTLRARRSVTDNARAVLPAATLTNVGMTANARSMAHAVTKLLSDELDEMKNLGRDIRCQATTVVPTLLKYADPNEQVIQSRLVPPAPPTPSDAPRHTTLMEWDHDAAQRVARGLQYPQRRDAAHTERILRQHSEQQAAEYVARQLRGRKPHDPLPRALELTRYTAEIVIDYGALRELRRHRMMTPISQPLRVLDGYTPAPMFTAARREDLLASAAAISERLYAALHEASPALSQYAVTHAHRQRIIIDLNLRELAELLRLRTSPRAHEAIRQPCRELEHLIRQVQPNLIDAVMGPSDAA